jgi:hypothetical protein
VTTLESHAILLQHWNQLVQEANAQVAQQATEILSLQKQNVILSESSLFSGGMPAANISSYDSILNGNLSSSSSICSDAESSSSSSSSPFPPPSSSEHLASDSTPTPPFVLWLKEAVAQIIPSTDGSLSPTELCSIAPMFQQQQILFQQLLKIVSHLCDSAPPNLQVLLQFSSNFLAMFESLQVRLTKLT